MVDQGKLRSFFQIMNGSSENRRVGFTVLMEQENSLAYFDEVVREGHYDPTTFPVPKLAGKDQSSYQVLPHPGLEFLVKVTDQAVHESHEKAIRKVIAIIKEVTRFQPEGRTQLDNFYVWRTFLEITTRIPVQFYDEELVTSIKTWLSSKFDKSFVASELAGLLEKLLKSDHHAASTWATKILEFIIDFEVDQRERQGTARTSLIGNIESYWLQKILKRTSESFGAVIGSLSAPIILDKILKAQEIGVLKPSHWARSAIEDHPQNLSSKDHEDLLVEGARDILLSWFRVKPQEGHEFFPKLIGSRIGIFQRLSLFLATELSPEFDDSVVRRIGACFADVELHHETYRFLENCFSSLGFRQKASIVSAIKRIKIGRTKKDQRRGIRQRLTWLGAIYRKGSDAADRERDQLVARHPDIKLTSHPDFLSFIETRWGPGESPASISELVSLAKNHELIQYLTEFRLSPDFSFDSPTLDGLTSTLGKAVKEQPDVFLDAIPDFLAAKPVFQYEVISAFAELRRGAKFPDDGPAWAAYWPVLINFAGQVILGPDFWGAVNQGEADDELAPYDAAKSWMPGRVADLLEMGLNNDEFSIPSKYLKKVEAIIVSSLNDSAPADKESGSDTLNYAINTTKGKAFGAMVAYALNRARNAAADERTGAWERLVHIFDRELGKCRDSHFSISALFGQYLAHFLYLSEQWVADNVGALFPHEIYPRNFRAALSGLAYCNNAHRAIYKSLQTVGVVDAAIRDDAVLGEGRETVLQRLGLALLWGFERPNRGPMKIAMDRNLVEDVAAVIEFIGRVHDSSVERATSDRAIELWRELDAWCQRDIDRTLVAASLADLLPYVDELNAEVYPLVERAIQKMDSPYEIAELTTQFSRLYERRPEETVRLLVFVVRTKPIYYDHEGQLKDLVRKLVQDFPKEGAEIVTALQGLSGFKELEAELKAED